MPYKSLKDANPSLLGIKPPITLAQANEIAAIADAIAAGKNPPDSPWAVAISSWKKNHVKGENGWTKKAKAAEMQREVRGQMFGINDFLVFGEKDDPTTYHLMVRRAGRPDHELMSKALQSLTTGYKGRVYDGPLKELALKRLTRLYESEGLVMPNAVPMKENTSGSLEDKAYAIKRSFDVIYGRPPGDEAYVNRPALMSYEVFNGHPKMGDCLIVCEGYDVTDKFYAVGYEINGDDITFQPRNEWRRVQKTWEFVESPQAETEAAESQSVDLAEFAFDESVGYAVDLIESDNAADPLRIKTCLIEAGWGNKRDNNYYSAQMLQEHADVFLEAKMFESDHNPARSNKDWVSFVDKIIGPTDKGGVVAEVVVHDEDFAKRARALQAAGKLHLLECSILAKGAARSGTVNGVPGKIVEAIREVRAVDWVTKAGAGGHALALTN